MADQWFQLVLGGGLNTEVHPEQIPEAHSPTAYNVDFSPGKAKPRMGLWPIQVDSGLPFSGVPYFADSVRWADGTADFIVITNSPCKFYLLSGGTTWAEKSAQVSGVASTFSGGDIPYTAAYLHKEATGSQMWFFANGGDLLSWDGTTCSKLEGGDAYQTGREEHNFRCIAAYQHRLFGGNAEVYSSDTTTLYYPIRWYYSDVGDWDTWGSTNYIDLLKDPTPITAGATLGNKLISYSRTGINAIYATAVEVTPFASTRMATGIGTPGTRSMVPTSKGHFFLSTGMQNVWLYRGGDSPIPVGNRVLTNPVRDFSPSRAETAVAMVAEDLEKVYFCADFADPIAMVGGTYIYDWHYKTWGYYAAGGMAMGTYKSSTSPKWSELEGTWSEQQWRWYDAKILGDRELPIFATPNGYIYQLSPFHVADHSTLTETGAGVSTKKYRPLGPTGGPYQGRMKFRVGEVQLRGKFLGLGCGVSVRTDEGLSSQAFSGGDDGYRLVPDKDLSGQWIQVSVYRVPGFTGTFEIRDIWVRCSETDDR